MLHVLGGEGHEAFSALLALRLVVLPLGEPEAHLHYLLPTLGTSKEARAADKSGRP